MVVPVTADKITLYGNMGSKESERKGTMLKVSVLEKGSEWASMNAALCI